jgi:AraC family transcriptional regulator
MSTGIVYLRPAPVLFVRARGILPAVSTAAWAKLLGWAESKGARGDIVRAYGMVRDHAGALDGSECRYDACIEAPADLTEDGATGITLQMLPGGAYVRHKHTEGSDRIAPALTWICQEWAPSRNMVVDSGRPMLEIYLTDPLQPANGKLRMDLCVPVSASAQRRVA